MNAFDLPVSVQGTGIKSQRGLSLDKYSPDELMDLRSQIDERMPIRRIKDVNMEQELVLQLQAVQRLQSLVIDDETTPANQKSQVAGAVAGALATLGKLQVEIYSSERLKRIEAILIEVINEMPKKVQESFFEKYETLLGAG